MTTHRGDERKESGTDSRSSEAPRRSGQTAASNGVLPGILPAGKLYYRIGEVSTITGVKPHVLRYWESEFRWMTPQKSRSKQRLYRAKDIETILLIKRLLYDERYTIAGARKRLQEVGMGRALEQAARASDAAAREAGGDPAESPADSSSRRLAEYREIREELIALRALL